MSEQKVVKSRRMILVTNPQESGLYCPLCGCRTLNRDTAPAGDGWYVEYCSGGVIWYREVDDGEVIDHEFECPYAWAGFKTKRRKLKC